jgi:signal transduction histidine kinase
MQSGFLLLAEEITERKIMESQLVQAQKLESIGQLAAGIAHEINTPTQYVGDNTRFLQESFTDISGLLEKYYLLLKAATAGPVSSELITEVENSVDEADIEYLLEEIPTAIQQSLEGVDRVSRIVRAMKEFSHPGVEGKTVIDINKAIESTIMVARNEWKYVAEMKTDFDPHLPLVPCLPGEFNQVILNILLNAAHAITDAVGDGSKGKGTITVSTRRDDEWAEIRISDTGTGIPEEVRTKIFDPFFTTKEVGKGTGQGLAISHSVIAEKHDGTITFETEMGKGTTFIIRLPISPDQ